MQSTIHSVKQAQGVFFSFNPVKSQSWRWLAIGFVAVWLSAITVAQVCAPQPSSWWPGDGNATDLAAGNNGTLIGSVTFADGEVGQAFSFNGSGYVSFGITPSIIGTGPLTIELWLKTGGNGFIITQRDSGGINGEYLLWLAAPPMASASRSHRGISVGRSTVITDSGSIFVPFRP